MKQWTVTYREKSGLKTSVVIEAEDRAGVFAELKQRGINAISITEGAVKAKRKATGAGVSKGVWGVVAAVVVAAIVGVVWMMMPDAGGVSSGQERVDVRTGELQKRRSNEAQDSETAICADGKVSFPQEKNTLDSQSHSSTNLNQKQLIAEEAKKLPPPVFKSASDDIIAKVISGEGDIPPLPDLGPDFDKEFLRSLKVDIEINDDDTPEVKAIKENVRKCRMEIVALMEEGQTFSQVLNTHRDLVERNAEVRSEAIRSVAKLIKEGDLVLARDYFDKVNETLEELGIKKMSVPRSIMTEAEIEENRKRIYDKFYGEEARRRRATPQPHFK